MTLPTLHTLLNTLLFFHCGIYRLVASISINSRYRCFCSLLLFCYRLFRFCRCNLWGWLVIIQSSILIRSSINRLRITYSCFFCHFISWNHYFWFILTLILPLNRSVWPLSNWRLYLRSFVLCGICRMISTGLTFIVMINPVARTLKFIFTSACFFYFMLFERLTISSWSPLYPTMIFKIAINLFSLFFSRRWLCTDFCRLSFWILTPSPCKFDATLLAACLTVSRTFCLWLFSFRRSQSIYVNLHLLIFSSWSHVGISQYSHRCSLIDNRSRGLDFTLKCFLWSFDGLIRFVLFCLIVHSLEDNIGRQLRYLAGKQILETILRFWYFGGALWLLNLFRLISRVVIESTGSVILVGSSDSAWSPSVSID